MELRLKGPDVVGASQYDVCKRDVQFAIGMMYVSSSRAITSPHLSCTQCSSTLLLLLLVFYCFTFTLQIFSEGISWHLSTVSLSPLAQCFCDHSTSFHGIFCTTMLPRASATMYLTTCRHLKIWLPEPQYGHHFGKVVSNFK